MLIQQITQYVSTKLVFFAISFSFCNELRGTPLESACIDFEKSVNKGLIAVATLLIFLSILTAILSYGRYVLTFSAIWTNILISFLSIGVSKLTKQDLKNDVLSLIASIFLLILSVSDSPFVTMIANICSWILLILLILEIFSKSYLLWQQSF